MKGARKSYLGHLEKLFRDLDDTAQLLDTLNTLLDSRSMALSRGVEDVLHLVDLAIGPFLVHGSPIMRHGPEDGESGKHDNGLFIDHIDLIRDGVDGDTGAGGEDGGLGDERVARESIDYGLGFFARFLGGHVGCVACGVEADGGGREGSRDCEGSQSAGA